MKTRADIISDRNEQHQIARAAEAAGRFAEAALAWEAVAALETRAAGNSALAYAEAKAIDCAAKARRA